MFNRVQLIGNTGRDVDIKYFPDGTAVAELSLATSKAWKDKQSGELKTKTEWHKLKAYAKKAEFIKEKVKKGDQIFIEGELTTRKWQSQSGEEHYSTEIIVQSFKVLNNNKSVERPSNQNQQMQNMMDEPFNEEKPPF